jgi:cytochrome o ubiquinol oxidase operon protein cyoD
MNNTAHTPETTPHEHGTIASYIVGFILSLVFTAIPYFLVTKHAVAGNALVATILGFAVLQMGVQLVFFLHLGREKKPYWQSLFLVSTVGIILVVVGGSMWIMHHLHYNMTPVTREDVSKQLIEGEGVPQIDGKKTGACEGVHDTYKVTLKGGAISPSHIDAHMCDKLTFINEDSKARYIMFGSFDQPEPYGGEDMLTIYKGHPKTIILNESGTHYFHDHMNDETSGQFTVAP